MQLYWEKKKIYNVYIEIPYEQMLLGLLER